MREFEFIDWIRSQSRFDPAVVRVGPGDDAAVVAWAGRRVLVTVDQALDGVHFELARHGPQQAGRKAMARSLSDVAAMAGRPWAAVASVALPQGAGADLAQNLYMGLRKLADEFACPLVGGDVGAWTGPLAISVTVLAVPDGVEPVLRGGAKPGDAICVSGALGGAWRGLRHLSFMPRVHEARLLAGRYGLHAMIDLSDGLASDLRHVCRASGVGARISAAAVPISPDVDCQNPPERLRRALCDGEDYELLFALPMEQARDLVRRQPLGVQVSLIGQCTDQQDVVLAHDDGRVEPLPAGGYEHTTQAR
jgi:thiamine-monophosphate kinase